MTNINLCDSKNKYLYSLQGLRAIAFLGIFFEHSGIASLGSWGVSVFIVLSGFLMYYNYCHRTICCNDWLQRWYFSVKKIYRLYHLHIITFLAALLIYDCTKWSSVKAATVSILKILTNLTLLQTCIPKSEFYFSFNMVSWYLSLSLFLYLFYPTIQKLLIKISIRTALKLLVCTILLQLFISVVLNEYSKELSQIPVVISDDIVKWITYISPIYRMGDFFCGCLLGKLYSEHYLENIFLRKVYATIIECGLLFSLPLLLQVYYEKMWPFGLEAFRYSLLWIVVSMGLVYDLAYERGPISWVLSRKIFVFVGNISAYAFLLHQIIIVVLGTHLKGFMDYPIIVLVSFAVTVMLSKGYRFIYLR